MRMINPATHGVLLRPNLILLLLMLCGASGPAAAQQLLNVDFGTGNGLSSPKVGPAATGLGPGDVWNLYSRDDPRGGFRTDGTLTNLAWSEGVPSGIALSVWNAPGAWLLGIPDPMFNDYLYPLGNTDPIRLSLTNLPTGEYDLYLYGHGGPGIDAANTRFHVEANGEDHGSLATTVGPEWASPTWQEGAQYVRFRSIRVAGPAGSIHVSAMRDGYEHACLNGLQLVRSVGPALWFVPEAGSFTNRVTVTLVTPHPGAEIRYTLDGSEPTAAATRYESPLPLTNSTSVRARLFVNGFPASEIVSGTYERVLMADILFSPPAGWFTNTVTVSLLNRVGVGSIHYTTNGTAPSKDSAVYSAPLELTTATSVQARLFLNGFPVSETVTAEYARVYAFADDGVPFEWRERYFGGGFATDPGAAAVADPDLDGYTNREEYEHGTHPLDRGSAPSITMEVRAVPRLSFTTIPGKTYQIQRQAVLGDPTWEVLVPAFTATSAISFYTDNEAPAASYYRIVLVP